MLLCVVLCSSISLHTTYFIIILHVPVDLPLCSIMFLYQPQWTATTLWDSPFLQFPLFSSKEIKYSLCLYVFLYETRFLFGILFSSIGTIEVYSTLRSSMNLCESIKRYHQLPP